MFFRIHILNILQIANMLKINIFFTAITDIEEKE
jgi:hypothetical protein